VVWRNKFSWKKTFANKVVGTLCHSGFAFVKKAWRSLSEESKEADEEIASPQDLVLSN